MYQMADMSHRTFLYIDMNWSTFILLTFVRRP